MKPSRLQLEQQNASLGTENTVLTLALNDICNGAVKWFGNSRTFSLGITRPAGAAGGIAVVRENGTTSAHYFERYASEILLHVSYVITGENTEHNRELARKRSTVEAAQAYVSECQRNGMAA